MHILSIIIILVTATINHRSRMFHRFLTSMVGAIWLLHLACKAMLSNKVLIRVEVGTSLVEPVGGSRRILTRFSQGEEATVTTEEEVILVVTTNTIINNMSSMGTVKVGLSIITHESMVVSSITVSISKVATAEGVIIVVVIKHNDVLSLLLRMYESYQV